MHALEASFVYHSVLFPTFSISTIEVPSCLRTLPDLRVTHCDEHNEALKDQGFGPFFFPVWLIKMPYLSEVGTDVTLPRKTEESWAIWTLPLHLTTGVLGPFLPSLFIKYIFSEVRKETRKLGACDRTLLDTLPAWQSTERDLNSNPESLTNATEFQRKSLIFIVPVPILSQLGNSDFSAHLHFCDVSWEPRHITQHLGKTDNLSVPLPRAIRGWETSVTMFPVTGYLMGLFFRFALDILSSAKYFP